MNGHRWDQCHMMSQDEPSSSSRGNLNYGDSKEVRAHRRTKTDQEWSSDEESSVWVEELVWDDLCYSSDFIQHPPVQPYDFHFVQKILHPLIKLKLCADFHSVKRMNLNDFGEPVTFPTTPSWHSHSETWQYQLHLPTNNSSVQMKSVFEYLLLDAWLHTDGL